MTEDVPLVKVTQPAYNTNGAGPAQTDENNGLLKQPFGEVWDDKFWDEVRTYKYYLNCNDLFHICLII